VTLPDFLHFGEYGEIFLAGHRITLYHVIKEYQDSRSAETLAATYPTLPLALVHKVIAFYLENQAEVDQYVEQTRAEIERQAAVAPQGPSLAELKQRLEAKRRAERA
jgi:uncharacterized protein (DUF433 family)